jgi:hypothetical protein
MASTNIQINFSKAEEDVEDLLFLELDPEANEEKTTFTAGDKVYLRFLFANDDPYTINVNMGTAKIEATNVHYPVEDEELQFPNKDSAYLRYVPCNNVAYEWIGNVPETPVFSGRKVMLNEPAVAVLNCEYETKGDRLSIKSDTAGTVLIVVIQGENQVSLSLAFEEKGGPVDYELKVVDYCTGEILSDVTVYFDGVDIGKTNENGIIALGELIPKSTHTLKMDKSGYLNSEDDKLNNDSFTVPESEEEEEE